MELCGKIPLLGLWWMAVFLVNTGQSYMVGKDPYHQRVHLGPRGIYVVEWRVDQLQKRVTFNVTVETRGFVGFGLSTSGKMSGADIVIGGVTARGKAYFSDRHAVGNQRPELDPSQDWNLLDARESATHTFLSFWRVWDTCDPQDYVITEDKISMIWAFGEKDNEDGSYHHGNRGSYQVYVLHPDYSPAITHQPPVANAGTLDKTNMKVWTINTVMEVPERETSYWCTMHKGPVLPRKHHVIGLDVRLDEPATRHTHHLILHKCNAPANRSPRSMFQSFVNYRGHECFQVRTPQGPMPTEYCTELNQNWAIGGRAMFHPPHVGVPIGTEPDEYYLLQIHFDNVDNRVGVRINVSLDMYYTSEVRRHDAGMMWIRHENPSLPPSLLVPPSSINQNILGICGADCTNVIFPPDGIHLYAMMLHSHNAGRVMRMHHFRGKQELPWVLSDENYAFNYQQWRVLTREAHILPGDQVVARCVYDNTAGNGSSVVGGYGTRQEMCTDIFFYYNRIPNYDQCYSGSNSPQARQRLLGVGNITWSGDELEWIVDSPPSLSGLKISEVADRHVQWDAERRNALQRFQLMYPQQNQCPMELHASGGTGLVAQGQEFREQKTRLVTYPYEATPYSPERSCTSA